MSHFVKPALLALGGLAGVFGFAAANAGNAGADVPSVIVKYSDVSLSSDSGVQELYRRIVRAAAKVCPDSPVKSLSAQFHVAQCRDQAVARAIRQIDNSQLAALYAAHTKNG